MSMKILDLTHDITEHNIVFPGHPQPRLETVYTFENNGFQVMHFSTMSHNGTHIDAPLHTLESAPSLYDLPLSHYCGSALLIDIRHLKNTVTVGDLLPYADRINQTDFVVFMCGHEKLWGTSEYFNDYPIMTVDTVRWICDFDLYGIGIDAFSVDTIDSRTHINHRLLASKEMIVIENLANLETLYCETSNNSGSFFLSVFPLKYKNADGSPVRAVAFIQNTITE